MIAVGSYDDWNSKSGNEVSISCDGGKRIDFKGEVINELCPSPELISIWNRYAGFCSDELRERMFVEKYYTEVLSKLDPLQIYGKLDNKIVLDYEENPTRQVLCSWFDIMLGIPVDTYENFDAEFYFLNENCNKNIRETLERVMKSSTSMMGFHSLQAVYIYKKFVEMEEMALIQKDPKLYNEYMQTSVFLRSIIDEVEEKYKDGKKSSVINFEVGFIDSSEQEFWLEEQGCRLCSNRQKPYIMTKVNKQINGQISFSD